MPRNRFLKRDFTIHRDVAHALKTTQNDTQLDAPSTKTLTPASTGTINSMTTAHPASNPAKHAIARSVTIRSVPSFDGSDSSPDSKRSVLSSSVNSTTSAASAMQGTATGTGTVTQQDKIPSSTKIKQDCSNGNGNTNVNESTPSRWHSNGVRAVEPSLPHDSSTLSEEADNGQWDSTIGKAGLGKTGRVINKLVSDNDALKRDIQIERLRAEEAKQAAKLLEDKMERMMSEYEGRLLEANVTKTLLARKERQVESLTGSVELEKRKTQAAQQSERCWKEELNKVQSDSKVRIEEATSYAQLMEGRYNAISSHWRDQGDEVKRAISKMKSDITSIVDERRSDDEKITTLRDLCEQQDNNIKELRREKEDIARLFEEYKRTQDESLRDIKMSAINRQEEQEKQLEEAKDTLQKLRWALNVKENVRDAQ